MRGRVLKYDGMEGEGAILGEDGGRYRFVTADIHPSSRLLDQGLSVDFVPSEDRRAGQIIVVRDDVPRATTVRHGQFDLGRVMERTFTIIGKNAAVFFGASALLVGVPSALSAYGQTNAMTSEAGMAFVFIAIGTVLYLVGLYVLQGMVVKAAVNSFNGQTTSFGDAFNVGIQKFFPLLGLGIVAGVGMGLGYILLIVPGVILTVMWSVAAPAVVAEKRGVFDSLQRSRDLTRGYRWHVFGLLVIYLILSWIVGIAVGGLSVAFGGGFLDGAPNIWVAMISGPVVNILSGVVASAGVAALYYELRTAKEGVGSEDLAAVFD